MKLRPLPALADNYIWMLHDGHDALVVDPGDATVVLQALEQEGVQLRGILVTHHHGDHVGGVAHLRDQTGAAVFGPANESMPEPITRLSHDQYVTLLGLTVRIIAVPGHTAGHLAYYCEPPGDDPIVFCGDTLFCAGCGRLFEGTPAQMQASLALLMALPDTSRICCAHEYTLGNLRFAATVEPDNTDIAQQARHCQDLREKGLPTLPSTIGLERRINPFVRTEHVAVATSARQFDALQTEHQGVFATLRQWKNQF